MSFNDDIAADAADILNDIGEAVTIDGSPSTGWFVDEFHQVDLGEGLINTTQPMLIVATAVPPMAREDSSVVLASGDAYVVIGPPVPTGVALTVNYLRKVSP